MEISKLSSLTTYQQALVKPDNMVEELDWISSQGAIKPQAFPFRSGATQERISCQLGREVRPIGRGGEVAVDVLHRSVPGLGQEAGERHQVWWLSGEDLKVRYGVSAQPLPVKGDPVGAVAGVHGSHHTSKQTILWYSQPA